ncbi:MFS transporter [uncultured Castellaniella sp.]|uniref:MFS transporter n=1 Tax=uncultured Castellaniella sp. TaxID=647907 RepID=UPI002608095F|nr:MFS transporter [uncultured Castellaniella sp.]
MPSPNQPAIRRIPAFTTIALALLMMSVDSTIVATVLHELQRGLDTSINWVGWTITAFAFGFVLMLPVSGKLSERIGRRRVFLASVAIFTLASLLCGLSDSIAALIVLRALQAAGGAGITPSATGIVVDYFGDGRDRAVSLFGSIFPIGAMIGPIFGGLFVTYWNWRGVFFVNVPIGLLILWMTLRYIPPDAPRARKTGASMDYPGLGYLGVCLLAGMLATSFLGERDLPFTSPRILLPAAAALAAGWLFFRHIHRSGQPFIAPHLIHGPGFGVVNLINMLFGGITIGAVALIPLYAANRYGMGALGSGTLLVFQGIAAILLSLACTLTIRRTGYRRPLYAGGALIVLGMILLALPPVPGVSPFVWLAATAFLLGMGTGTVNPASRNAGLQLAPQSASTLAALRTLAIQIGTITFISVVTMVLSSSSDPGRSQAWVYGIWSLLVLASLPLIARVPEHRGAW